MAETLHDRVLKLVVPLAEKLQTLQFQTLEAHIKAGEGDHADIATNADNESDTYLHQHLPQLVENSWVLSEETPVASLENRSEYTWIVDPLDGTVNYSHRLPLYGISIALFKGPQPVYGLLYFPALNQYVAADEHRRVWFGSAGRAFTPATNGVPFVTVSKSPNIPPAEHGLVIQKLAEVLRTPRDFGCCIYQAYLAITHHVDCAMMYNVAIWDMAAAMYIADCAGLETHYWSAPLADQLHPQSSSTYDLGGYQQTAAIGTAHCIAAVRTIEW